MMKIRHTALGLVAALSLVGCDNDSLTELNQNPNNPEDVPAATLFTDAVRVTNARWGGGYAYSIGELLAQHLAQVQYPDQDTYARLGAGDTQTVFDNPYVGELEDLQQVIRKGLAADQPGTYAPALVMRTYGFMKLTDTFGDIPYFEALAGDSIGGSAAPKYDAQQAIYADFFVVLAKATADLASGGSRGNLGSGDPIYGGNALQWQRFSNSLRARLAMRLANVDPAKASAELLAARNAPGGLMQSNADNAVLEWPGDGIYNNPWSDNFKTRDDYRVSKTLLDIMNPLDDPRVEIYAQPTPADPTAYVGLQNGLTHAQGGSFFNTTSRPGAFLFPGATVYGTYGGSGAKAPTYMLTYAEVQFILAEAAARNMGGLTSAQAAGFYNEGVRASLRMWSDVSSAAGGPTISNAEIDAYLARVAYQGGTAGQVQIAQQKWIHLYTDGGEAWAEWRRTCVPSTNRPGPAATQNTVPRRLMYSPTEYSVNREQVDLAIAAQGDDTFNSRMYWDRQPTAAPTYTAGCGTR